MKLISLTTACLISLISMAQQKPFNIENFVQSFTEAKNTRDFSILEPFLHEQVKPTTPFIKKVITFDHDQPAFDKGTVKSTLLSYTMVADDTSSAMVKQSYSNGFTDTANFIFACTALNQWKLIRIKKGFMYAPLSITSTTSYKMEGGFIESIRMNRYHKKHGSLDGYTMNLKFEEPTAINLEKLKKNQKNGYTVYYRKNEFKDAANYILPKIERLDKLAKNYLGIDENYVKSDVFLSKPSKQNYTLSGLVWLIELENKKAYDGIAFNSNLIYKLVHENTESTLVNLNIKDNNTRWFRDGMAELIVQYVCEELDGKYGRLHFQSRKQEIDEFGRETSLLDWTSVDKSGKDYVDNIKDFGTFKYHAQYARSFMFLYDFFEEHGRDKVAVLMHEIQAKSTKNISIDEIIDMMNAITGDDIEKRIALY